MATGGINAQYNARVDHHFSEKNSLFARYAYWKADSNAYDAWGTHTAGQGHTGIYTHSAILGDTHAFNPSTILDLRLSYLRVFQHEFPNSQGVDLSQFGPGWGGLAGQLVAPANYPAMNFNDTSGSPEAMALVRSSFGIRMCMDCREPSRRFWVATSSSLGA